MHYLDNAATTKPCEAAINAAVAAMTDGFGNPSSVHDLGFMAETALKTARKDVAAAIGCDPSELYFTSGGTEADNWAVIRGAELGRHRGKHIITTAVEHHGVLEPAAYLESQGYEVTYLEPDETGRISVESLTAALRPDTVLISVMMVNNETGAVNDIAAMVKAVKSSGSRALFHTDAVQGLFKVPFKFKTLGIDMLSFSGHKIHAVKGIGGLVVKKGINLKPLILGGGQESGKRSGTEAMPAIMAMAAACKEGSKTLRQDLESMAKLKELVISGLPENAVVVGAHDAPHVVNVAVPGIRSQGLINCLQEKGVYVSAGSACSKGKRSHVLTAMGLKPELIDGSVRVSLSKYSTEDDAAAFLSALDEAIKRLS